MSLILSIVINSFSPISLTFFWILNSIPFCSKWVKGILCPSMVDSKLLDISKLFFLSSLLSSTLLSSFFSFWSFSSSFCSSAIFSSFPYIEFNMFCGANVVFCSFPTWIFILISFNLASFIFFLFELKFIFLSILK